jgi:patatin-like phospholipase/acyl hydrolase
MTQKVTILSIDGGGIRGIIPAVILEHLEKRLQEMTGKPDARLADFFDMIAGTSTGGILSCFYLHPGRQAAGQAVDLYAGKGKSIFKPRFPGFLNKAASLFASKYPAKGLEKALNEAFGAVRLSETGKHSLITAYDIEKRRSVLFTVPSAQKHPARDFFLKDIARATSAAPTYFPPASVVSAEGEQHTLVDGAMFANDPALCALVEARKTTFVKHEYPIIRELYILSVGTGKVSQGFSPEKASHWGLAGWAVPVVDMLMTASPEVVSYQLKQLFSVAGCAESYVRMEPGLCDASSETDNVSDANIAHLRNAGETFASANAQLLDEVARQLILNN